MVCIYVSMYIYPFRQIDTFANISAIHFWSVPLCRSRQILSFVTYSLCLFIMSVTPLICQSDQDKKNNIRRSHSCAVGTVCCKQRGWLQYCPGERFRWSVLSTTTIFIWLLEDRLSSTFRNCIDMKSLILLLFNWCQLRFD